MEVKGDGILVVNFNEDIKVPQFNDEETTRFDLKSLIEITFIQMSDEPIHLRFSLKLLKFTPKEIRIQMNFDHPEHISQDG